jgi:hypothetical protein
VLKDTEQRVAYEKSDIKKEMADFTAAVQHSHMAQMDRVWDSVFVCLFSLRAAHFAFCCFFVS